MTLFRRHHLSSSLCVKLACVISSIPVFVTMECHNVWHKHALSKAHTRSLHYIIISGPDLITALVMNGERQLLQAGKAGRDHTR